ncbi:MAG: ABC transporter permease [Gammaproteobacteria bacterium]|nr:ABC transporter permease [Gammaproteobacteria bacterium]
MATGLIASLPRPTLRALTIWRRNLLVWRKLMISSLLINLGEPLLYLLGLGYGMGRFIGDMAGMPYLTFLASGMIATSAMNSATYEGLYSVFARMTHQRTYEAILATPMEVDDIVLGEICWAATKGTLSSAAIMLVGVALGALNASHLLWSLPVTWYVGACFAGLALTCTAFAPSYDFFNYFITLLLTPMMLLCGVFFPVDALPSAIQPVIGWLPLTHAVALIRPLATGEWPAAPLQHVLALGVVGVAGYWSAVVLTRRRLLR